MSEKKERKASIVPGVIEKKNKDGKVISYKFMTCVDRDERYKQIWKTCTISVEDPRIKDLTPAKLKKALSSLKTEWDKQAAEEYEKSKTTTNKDSITFYDFTENHWWKDHVKDGKHSLNSVSFFRSTKKTSLDYFGKQIKLSEITPELVKKYLNDLSKVKNSKGKQFSGTSQMHHFSTFRNIMEYAYRLGYIQEDPCLRMGEKERPKRDKREIDFMDSTQAQRFLACADNEYDQAMKTGELGTVFKAAMWRCYLYLLVTTGLRRGEAVGLQWGDLDSEKLTLNISRSVCLDKSSETKMMLKSTKTGENRIVAVLSQVYEMLDEYKQIQANYFDLEEVPSESFIFCNESDILTPIYATTPTRYISKFVKRNNLPNVSPHDLRHTAASLALESGAGIKEISELMGHSDIGTTSKFYAALTQEAKRRTVEGIGGLLFKPSQNAQSGQI